MQSTARSWYLPAAGRPPRRPAPRRWCPGEVGQLDSFDVAPDHVDRVEVVRVAGQLLDDQPVPLGASQAFICLDLWEDRPSQISVIFSAPKWGSSLDCVDLTLMFHLSGS